MSLLIAQGNLHSHGSQTLGVDLGFPPRGDRIGQSEHRCVVRDPSWPHNYNFPLHFFRPKFNALRHSFLNVAAFIGNPLPMFSFSLSLCLTADNPTRFVLLILFTSLLQFGTLELLQSYLHRFLSIHSGIFRLVNPLKFIRASGKQLNFGHVDCCLLYRTPPPDSAFAFFIFLIELSR